MSLKNPHPTLRLSFTCFILLKNNSFQTNQTTMKFLHLFTPSLYIVLNAHSASAAYLQGKACDYLDDQCGRDKYCQAATGQCLLKSASIPGTCEVPPQTCNLDYNPVCGCDSKSEEYGRLWFIMTSSLRGYSSPSHSDRLHLRQWMPCSHCWRKCCKYRRMFLEQQRCLLYCWRQHL